MLLLITFFLRGKCYDSYNSIDDSVGGQFDIVALYLEKEIKFYCRTKIYSHKSTKEKVKQNLASAKGMEDNRNWSSPKTRKKQWNKKGHDLVRYKCKKKNDEKHWS